MSAITELVFSSEDARLREIPVTIGKDQYTLREADEGTAVDYRNSAISKTKMEDGKVVGAAGLASIEVDLVGACLYPKGTTTPVGPAFVRTLPARIVKKLHEWIMEASGLREKDEEKAGKAS